MASQSLQQDSQMLAGVHVSHSVSMWWSRQLARFCTPQPKLAMFDSAAPSLAHVDMACLSSAYL